MITPSNTPRLAIRHQGTLRPKGHDAQTWINHPFHAKGLDDAVAGLPTETKAWLKRLHTTQECRGPAA